MHFHIHIYICTSNNLPSATIPTSSLSTRAAPWLHLTGLSILPRRLPASQSSLYSLIQLNLHHHLWYLPRHIKGYLSSQYPTLQLPYINKPCNPCCPTPPLPNVSQPTDANLQPNPQPTPSPHISMKPIISMISDPSQQPLMFIYQHPSPHGFSALKDILQQMTSLAPYPPHNSLSNKSS